MEILNENKSSLKVVLDQSKQFVDFLGIHKYSLTYFVCCLQKKIFASLRVIIFQ